MAAVREILQDPADAMVAALQMEELREEPVLDLGEALVASLQMEECEQPTKVRPVRGQRKLDSRILRGQELELKRMTLLDWHSGSWIAAYIKTTYPFKTAGARKLLVQQARRDLEAYRRSDSLWVSGCSPAGGGCEDRGR